MNVSRFLMIMCGFSCFTLVGCSSPSSNAETVSPAESIDQIQDSGLQTNVIGASLDFRSGLSETQATALSDVFQPTASTQLMSSLLMARGWLEDQYSSRIFDQPNQSLSEINTLTDTLSCELGTVSRREHGVPVLRFYQFDFDQCLISEQIIDGIVSLQYRFFSCDASGLVAEFSNLTVRKNEETYSGTGSANYGFGSINCGSAAGGPPGAWGTTEINMSTLVQDTANGKIEYIDFTLRNDLYTESSFTAASNQSVEFETKAVLPAFNGAVLSISTPVPVYITQGVTVANEGMIQVALSDSNDLNDAVEFEMDACFKDLISLHTTTADQSQTVSLSWSDATNLLNQLRTPLRFNLVSAAGDDNYTSHESIYSAEQMLSC